MFRFDKFTQKAQEALQQAQGIADKAEGQVLFPLHLLIALAQEREGIVRPVLEKCGVQPDAIVSEGERQLQKHSQSQHAGLQPGLYASQPLNEVLERAFDEASRFKDEFVSTEHLLLAIAAQKRDPAGQLLDRAGATHDAILKALVSIRGTQRVTDPESRNQIPGARALRRRPHRIRPRGQARPGHRPRRRNPPRDAGAQPPHQEQPRAHRRARRRQDRHRGRPGPAHRAAATCPINCSTRSWSRSISAPWSPAPSSAASSKTA